LNHERHFQFLILGYYFIEGNILNGHHTFNSSF